MAVIAPTSCIVIVVEAAKTSAKSPAPRSFEGIATTPMLLATATLVVVAASAGNETVVLLVMLMRGACAAVWRVPPS
jgi:hypothetical protein